MNSVVQLETQWSKPIQIGDRKIITQSRALQICFPFLDGGFVWTRPTRVIVLSEDGRDQVLPVQDITRIIQIALFFIGFILAIAIASSRDVD